MAATLAFFLCCWLAVGQEGFVEGGPVEVLGITGATIMFTAMLLSLATIFIAARRAHLAGSWLWFAAVIFIWPASYLYTLAVNRRG
ncbi:hypothetical protein CSC65_06050 [Pseudoxanthomonas daejeonensis]|uniref:Transmembrane protein n=1 Tax=Pseudoxanthomonas daejeonensis TaxID=266062 RepID=A0ABQ6Z9I5_9GAMM|nr:hypothetical protein CSC65_06050 [Pseudoxanthomonas daejeonensis]